MTTDNVDPRNVDPLRLIRLLEQSGWKKSGGRDGLYARYAPPGNELGGRQSSVVVPSNREASDFDELINEALATLSRIPSFSAASTMVSRLATSPTDEFSFAKETQAPKGWIQWDEGASLIQSARSLLVAGAKTAREHLTYFGNRHGQFANRFLDEVMMGQTEVGSYVVRAYVPVQGVVTIRGGQAAEAGLHFVGQDVISTREVSESVASTLTSVTEALIHHKAHNTLSAFTAPELGLSYEAVLAIKQIAQDADHAGVTISWDTEGSEERHEQEFSFTAGQVPILERAANELVTPEPVKSARGLGSVHLLTRVDVGGPGVIGVTTIDGSPAKKLRVHLTAEDYAKALEAHGDGSLIEVQGTLEKEGNLSHLYRATVTDVQDSGGMSSEPDDASKGQDQLPLG